MNRNVTNETFEVRSFGEKFKELREMTGLKHLHFESNGYGKTSLSNYENGRRRVSKRDRIKLINIVKKTTDKTFDEAYYQSSAEEELVDKVSHYSNSLYNDDEAFVRAVNKAISLKMIDLVIDLYYEKGKYLFGNYQYRDSIREYMMALNYIKKPKSRRPEIYKSIADSFEKLNEMSGCESYLRLALDINKTDSELRFRCLYALSRVYVELKDLERCELVLGMIYHEYDDPVKRIYADMVQATLLNNSGDIEKAISFVKEKLSDVPDQYEEYWLHNLSTYCVEARDFQQAIAYILRILETESVTLPRCITKNVLADVYIKIGLFQEAKKILDEIRSEVIDLGDVFHIVRWYENKIKITEDERQYMETELLMDEALRVCDGYSDLKGWCMGCIKDIIDKRKKCGEELGTHCENIRKMIINLK